MSKKTVDSATSSKNVNSSIKPGQLLTGNTKMFILPPNVLQNICISDSIKKDKGIVSALECVKHESALGGTKIEEHQDSKNSNVLIKPTTFIKNSPTTSRDNATLRNTTKVPKDFTNDEKLIPKGCCTEQEKKDIDINLKKKRRDIKVDNSANYLGKGKSLKSTKCVLKNVKNSETTSSNVSNSPQENIESEQSSKKNSKKNIEKHKGENNECKINENVLCRSKRIRKQTKFNDYITSYKKEPFNKAVPNSDEERNSVLNKESRKSIVSSTSVSITGQANDIHKYINYTKESGKKSNENNTSTDDSHTSITPAVTEDSLPFSIKNNEKTNCTKRLKYCNNVEKNKNSNAMVEKGANYDSKIHIEVRNISVTEDFTVKDSVLHTALSPEKARNYCSNNNSKKKTCSTSTPTRPSTLVNQENLSTDTMVQSDNNQTSGKTLMKKRGRPKKNTSILQGETPMLDKSSKLENVHASQNASGSSIAETVHNKRHSEKSYDISNNDGSSDGSSIEDNIPNSITVNKRGKPAGASANVCISRGRDRGRSRSRGRGRGRGKGRGSHHSTSDAEYVPKSKGPTSTVKVKEENSDELKTTSCSEDVDLIACAKCEIDVPKKQWSSHNLLKHNNMSWIKGDEPMDFENDIKLWRKVLMSAIKKRRGQLSCEKCGTIKRSANGFISHMQFCGKSEEEKQALMVSCSTCGAIMMPSSMEIHERVHRQTEKSKIKQLESSTNDNERVKRKAAEKAVTKILEFTELVKDNNVPPEKKMKLQSSLLKSIIKTPDNKRSVPAVWKGIWKKELLSEGTIACRQLGCTYASTSFQDMCDHFSKCNFTPEECYICKICKFSTASNEDMIKHVSEEHSTVEIDQGSDFEENCSSDEKSNCTMKFLDREQMCKIRWSEPYFPTVQWTMQFEQKNYELYLFHNYTPNHFTLLKNKNAEKYLPELELSMRTKKESTSEKSTNSDIPWKQWKRFEGGLEEGTPTFFVGGPVWALAWLPIPSPMYSEEPCQYIAVSTHPTMESEYSIGKSHSGHNMIQIWNVGPLNHESDNKREPPTLSYSIVHNYGTIWSLEWCPSGCYQDESLNNYKKENETESSLKRMGMLAAACSDGNIYIYSLPFPDELKFEKTADNEWPIYSTDPIIALVVNIVMYDNKDQNWQCTKLSWTKERGHNTIAAGFSNGYIAIWDLTYKSPLSMQKRHNTYFINAFQHFYGHGNAVSMIAFVPYNGERFLASGSVDRTYKFWDLENLSTPQIYVQKGIIVDGAWMTHWPCAVLSYDDALSYKHTNTYLISLREHEFKYYALLATNSPAYALAVSDYANSISHGTLAGEILTIFAHELVHGRDIEKTLYKKRKLSSFTRITDFLETESKCKVDKKDKKNSKEYQYLPETYNECRDRFGITFCDNLKDTERYAQHQTLCADKLTAVPIEEYPFMSVNRILWNPNPWSYLWMTVGYQNGLVRLLSFKYMSMPHDLKTLLPQHVKSMLNKTQVTTKKCC